MARPLYEAERRAATAAPGAVGKTALPTWAQFAKTTLAQVEAQDLGRSEGAVVTWVSALSMPVFDHCGHTVLALTGIGPSAALDSRWGGPLADAMLTGRSGGLAAAGALAGRLTAAC